jgi:DnaJ-class molecular chaperone
MVAALAMTKQSSDRVQPTQETAVSYTYYDYLDLPPGASPVQIEANYVALLERFGYGTTDAGQDMSGLVRMIHAAYETLSNLEARRRYDTELQQEAAMADAELKATLDQQASPTARRVQNPPVALRNALASVAA